MLISPVTTPCDLPATAGAVADAAAALLALGVASASSGGAVSPRLRTHGAELQQKPAPVALSGGAPAWCGATYHGGPPTPTSALSPPPKRRLSSWSKPQSRVDVQAGAIKGVRDPSVWEQCYPPLSVGVDCALAIQRSKLAYAQAAHRLAVRPGCCASLRSCRRWPDKYLTLSLPPCRSCWRPRSAARSGLSRAPSVPPWATTRTPARGYASALRERELSRSSSHHSLRVITGCAATVCLFGVARAGAATRTRTCSSVSG
jgi:hypothetical protein